MVSLSPNYSKSQIAGRGLIQPAVYARRAASVGMIVHPLHSGKKPIPDDWNHRTTPPTAGEIRAWPYGCNYGILTGSRNHNLAVIDCDNPEICSEFERLFPDLTDTYIVTTRRGKHYYFYCETLPKTTKIPGVIELMADDEYSSGGKNIVGEGSIHASGHVYTGNGKKIQSVPNLAAVVMWISSKIVKATPVETRADVTFTPAADMTPARAHAYMEAVLNGEIPNVLGAVEGGQNNAIFSSARKIFSRVKAGLLPEETARRALYEAAERSGYVARDGKGQTLKTIESAYKRATPRMIPDRPRPLEIRPVAPVKLDEIQPAIFADGLPDSYRSAWLMKCFPTNTAHVMDLVIEASRAGLINLAGFTRPNVIAANERLKFGLSPSAIERTLKQLRERFPSLLPIVMGGYLSIGKSDGNPGKPPGMLCLAPLSELKRITLEAVQKHLNEGGLRPFTPAEMEWIGINASAAPEVADTTNNTLTPVFDQQTSNNQRTLNALAQKLDNLHSTAIPPEWFDCKGGYRAALLRATVEAAPDEQRSYKTLSAALGIAPRSVSKVIRDAGLKQSEPQFECQEITHAADLKRSKIKGYLRQVISTDSRGVVTQMNCKPADAPALVAEKLALGCTVRVKYQTANKQLIERDAPLPKRERAPIPDAMPAPVAAPKTQLPAPAELAELKAANAKARKARQVQAKLLLAVKLFGWIVENGRVIDPATGENCAADNPLAIIQHLTGIQLTQPRFFAEGHWWVQSYPPLEKVIASDLSE